MQDSNMPPKFAVPFANSAGAGYINPIPLASQIGIVAGKASLTDGFPPLTFISPGAGGTPPFGSDINGVLNQVTAWAQWQALGGPVFYDATFILSNGGYPKGALLNNLTAVGSFWISTVENNTSNPDTGGANWVAFNAFGIQFNASGSGSISAANTVLTTAQLGSIICFNAISSVAQTAVLCSSTGLPKGSNYFVERTTLGGTLLITTPDGTQIDPGNGTLVAGATGITIQNGENAFIWWNGTNWVVTGTFTTRYVNPSGALNQPNVWAAQNTYNGPIAYKEYAIPVSSGNATWDMTQGPNASLTITGATTLLAPVNPAIGFGGRLRIVNTTGNILTFASAYALPDGTVPLIDIAAGATTILDYSVIATSGVGYILTWESLSKKGPHVIIEDQKSSGTAAQTLTSAADNQRNLTALVQNYGGLSSLVSNQFVLPAGKHSMSFWTSILGPNETSGSHYRASIHNVTDNTLAIQGNTVSTGVHFDTSGSTDIVLNSNGSGIITIAATKTFELRTYSNVAATGGVPLSTGSVEVYAHVEITKI